MWNGMLAGSQLKLGTELGDLGHERADRVTQVSMTEIGPMVSRDDHVC